MGIHTYEESALLPDEHRRYDGKVDTSQSTVKERQRNVTPLERVGSSEDYDANSQEDDSSGQSMEKDKAKSIWRDTDLRQKAIILYIAVMNYINFLCNSAVSPFLARVVLQKGGTVVLSTIVLQASMITMTIFCVVVAKYQSRIGCKMLIVLGQVIFAISQILFGFIGCFQSQWMLVVAGTFLRAVQGTCQAALCVAGLTVVCQEFPDFVSTVFGIFEASYAAGYFSGPYLGGFLYDWSGGMMLPMLSTGVLMLTSALFGLAVLKRLDRCTGSTDESYLGLVLRKPKAVIIIGAAGTIAGGFGIVDATMTIYLKSRHFSATRVGQLLFLYAMVYCVFALICGLVNDSKVPRRIAMIAGILGCLAIPLAFTPNQMDTWIYIAGVGFGLCSAIAFVPGFNELLHVIHGNEGNSLIKSDMSLNSAVSGLWTASFSLFAFVLPIIGSFMQLTLSFSISFFLSMLVGYGATLIFGLVVFLRLRLKVEIDDPVLCSQK